MANEEIIEIPEDQVQIEEFSAEDEKKGAGWFALVLAIGAGAGAAITVAVGKGMKAIKKWQDDRYLKRKAREAELEAELAKRSQEQEDDSEEPASNDD